MHFTMIDLTANSQQEKGKLYVVQSELICISMKISNCDCPWSNIDILGKKEFATIYIELAMYKKALWKNEHSFTSSYQQVSIGCLVEI